MRPRAGDERQSRAALWHYGGLERDGDGLRTLAHDAQPLVRLIAAAALAREESRGAHLRLDFPALDQSGIRNLGPLVAVITSAVGNGARKQVRKAGDHAVVGG